MAPDHRFFALPGISSYSPEKLRLETESGAEDVGMQVTTFDDTSNTNAV